MVQHKLLSFHVNHRSLLLRLFHILLDSDLWTERARLLSSGLDRSWGKRKALGFRAGQTWPTQQPYNLGQVTLLLGASVFSVKWLVVRIKRTNAWKVHSTLRVASNHSTPSAARAWPDDAFVFSRCRIEHAQWWRPVHPLES